MRRLILSTGVIILSLEARSFACPPGGQEHWAKNRVVQYNLNGVPAEYRPFLRVAFNAWTQQAASNGSGVSFVEGGSDYSVAFDPGLPNARAQTAIGHSGGIAEWAATYIYNGPDKTWVDENAPGYTDFWTAAGVDDAWLVLDRDGDGLISTGVEMFGNFTPQPPTAERNGFIALAVFDSIAQGGNGDGWIDSSDAVFANLRLWQDRNHEGVSQSDELKGLAASGVGRISLEYRESRRSDKWGNWFRYRAKVVQGEGDNLGRWAYDVFLSGRPRR